MSRSRFLLEGLLKLCVAAACLVGAIAAYRLLVDPLIDSAFALGEQASSIVRRVNIFLAVVFSYWAFVRYYEKRAARELSFQWRWILLAAAAGAVSIGVTILALYATGYYQIVSFRGFGQATGILGPIWIAAVLEEVAFRGILLRILDERIGTKAALVGSAAVFGIVHLANNGAHWISLLSVTLLGLMWGGIHCVAKHLGGRGSSQLLERHDFPDRPAPLRHRGLARPGTVGNHLPRLRPLDRSGLRARGFAG